MAKEDNSNKNIDAELRRQRRLITMLLNRDRRRQSEDRKSSNTPNKKGEKYQKDINDSTKKLTKLIEDEIKISKDLNKLSREMKKIAQREAQLQELNNRIQNEANTLSEDELKLLKEEYDLLFEQLEIDKDNLLINQRSLQEDLKENRNEQKRHQTIVNNSEKLQKELEDMHEDMEDMTEALDEIGGKFDGLTELITAWNIADIKNSLEDDAASSRDLYRELANKMNRDMDDVMAEIKPLFKEQKKLYNDVFTSTEYLEALNAIYDSGQKNVEIATEMAGTMAAMDKTLGVSADSLDNVYTFLDASELKTLANNLAGINNLQLDNVSIEDLANSIDDLAPVLGQLSQDSQDTMLQMLATMEHYSIDTTNFTDTLKRVMSDEISASERAEALGNKGFKYYNALQSGDRAAMESAISEMFSDIQAGIPRSTLEAYYGDLLDDDMITKIQTGGITLEDFAKTYQDIGASMQQGSLEDMTKTVSDNLPFLSKIYNEMISGSVIEDFFQSDLWDNFGFGFQYFGAKLIEKFGGNLLQSGGNVLKNIWGWLTGGSMGTTITNALNSVINFFKTPIDDIAASIGTGGSIASTIGTISGYIAEILAVIAVFKSGKDLWNMVTADNDAEFAEAAEKSWGGKALSWLENKILGTDRLQAMFDAVKNGDTSIKEVKYIDEKGDVAYRYENSHAGGLSYVPYDGYQATLHKGEKILTAEEAKSYGLSEQLFNTIKDIKEILLPWYRNTGKVDSIKALSKYSAFNNGATSFTNPSSGAGIGTGGGSTIKDTLENVAQKVVDSLKNSSLGQTWDTVKDKASELWNSLKGTVTDSWDTAKGKVQELWNKLIDGSHKDGLANVPYDGYVAELHKGERVLTADENTNYLNAINQNAQKSTSLSSKLSEAGVIEQAIQMRDSYRNALYTSLNPQTGSGNSGGTTTPGGPVDEQLMLSGTEGFFQALGPSAKEGERQYNVFAATTLAQAALESGWGKSKVAKTDKNLFGIKWTGRFAPGLNVTQGLNCPSNEQGGARPYNRYQSYGDSMTDHAWFLANNKRYAQALQATNAKDQVRLIAAAGYAESGSYADSLIKMIDKYNLTQYRQGTPFVPNDQIALLHKGEMIVPASNNPYNLSSGSSVNTRLDNKDVVDAIGELKQVVKQAVEFIGRKMDKPTTVEVNQTNKVKNTLNERFKARQMNNADFL